VFLVTGDPAAALASTLGSTLPDAVEGIGASRRRRRITRFLNLSHRGISHWYMVYHIPILTLLAIDRGILPLPVNTPHFFSHFFPWQYLPPMISFFFVGACLHILGDALCGTVPGLIPGSRRVGIRLFKVNSIRETLLVFPVSFAAIMLRLAWSMDLSLADILAMAIGMVGNIRI